MSQLGETPGNKTIRLTREKLISDHNSAGDGVMSDYELDRWPHNELRPELTNEQMHELLEGRLVQRFFPVVEGIADASLQDTIAFAPIKVEGL